MLGKFLIAAAIISGVTLALILNTTTPLLAGAPGILIVFLCAYIFTLSLMTFLIYGLSRIVIFITGLFGLRLPQASLGLRRSYYFATVLAIVPVIIISMQSVGGVGIYELILIVLFAGIGMVYVIKRTS